MGLPGWPHTRTVPVWHRRIGQHGLLSLAASLFAAVLAVLGTGRYLTFSIVVGLLLLLILGRLHVLNSRRSDEREQVRAEVIWGLFAMLNEQIFGGNSRLRFTLWRQPFPSSGYVVAWYRYEKAGTDALREANRSRLRLPKGHGIVGQAWAEGGRQVRLTALPKFQDRLGMEHYLVTDHDMTEDEGKAVSDYTMEVRTMLSYAYLTESNKLLGVLNLELKPALVKKPDGALSFESQGAEVIIDWDGYSLDSGDHKM